MNNYKNSDVIKEANEDEENQKSTYMENMEELGESELIVEFDRADIRNETVRVEYLWMDFYGATL